MVDIAVITGIILIAFLALGMIMAKLYRRSSKEVAFVRTGFGGQKVIMDGGAVVLPILHEIIPVNMNTLRLEVKRDNEQALITKDRMRVDVSAEFYVRAKPSADSIAVAAQTLGMKTMNPQELKGLVEGKFVDALRAVAAEMAMKELHEQRIDFVQKVQQVVSEDLLKNGLELESVSLTGLDQTSKDYFNPDNAFDAEGLTKLTEEIESRKKRRNEIEQDTAVAIANKNLEAEKQRLEIGRDEEYAKLEQQREIQVRRAIQVTEIAKERAEREREAAQADIIAKQQVETSRITSERAVEEERIEKERLLKEKDIYRTKAVETAEIDQKKSVDLARIEQNKSIELSEQDRAIAIAVKSKDQSVAKAEADRALALAVQEEEKVVTVRESEIAERHKAVELVEASKAAEKDAIKIKVAAEAEMQAAHDRAQAVTTLANADADKERIAAKANSEAEIMKAEAAERRYAVEADGKRALNEAANLLSNEQISMQVRMALLQHLPDIIRESVKPMEHIEGIKIIQVDGLQGNGASGGNGEEGSGKNLSDQLVNSALRYRCQAPLIDSLLSDIGLAGNDINGLVSGLAGKTAQNEQ